MPSGIGASWTAKSARVNIKSTALAICKLSTSKSPSRAKGTLAINLLPGSSVPFFSAIHELRCSLSNNHSHQELICTILRNSLLFFPCRQFRNQRYKFHRRQYKIDFRINLQRHISHQVLLCHSFWSKDRANSNSQCLCLVYQDLFLGNGVLIQTHKNHF